MNLFINILLYFTPIALIISELVYCSDIIDYKISSLVATNLVSILPSYLCLYNTVNNHKNMMLEFIPFYSIIYTSSTYHLCTSINEHIIIPFCILSDLTYSYMDFINSYMCIFCAILIFIDFDNKYIDPNKFKTIIYSSELVFLSVTNIYISSELILIISNILLIFIPLLVSFYFNKTNIYLILHELLYFKLGVFFAVAGFTVYLLIYNKVIIDEYYWVFHSYLWHIFMFLCAFFLIKASTAVKPKTKTKSYVELSNLFLNLK